MKIKNNKKLRSYIVIIILLLITSYIIYNIATINKTYYKDEKDMNISIFVYHDIVENSNEIEYEYMQTTKEKFEKQIKGLQELGYHFISYDDLIKYNKNEKALPKNSCIVTFDDGWDGVYDYAYPIAKYNVPITSFIVNYLVGTDGYFTWEQAKEMKESGIVTIASHSLDHTKFDEKELKEAIENVEQSYEDIKQRLNSEEKIFTYPYGLYTEEQIEELGKIGYIQNLTDNRINKSSKLDMKRLHRCYPLNDNPLEIILKIVCRSIRYN